MNADAWPPPPPGARAPSPTIAGGAFVPPGGPPQLAPPTVHGVPTQPPSERVAPTQPVKLRSIGGIGLASRILVIVAAVIQLVSLGALLADSPNFFAQWIGPIAIVGHLVAGVVTVIWLFRAAANVETAGRSITFGPVWAIIGWFLPPLIFIFPSLQLAQVWKASSPDGDWKSGPSTPLAYIWGALYTLCGLAALATSIVTSQAASDELERLDPGQTVLVQWAPGVIVGALAAAGAAAVFVALNTSICKRQRKLAANASDAR